MSPTSPKLSAAFDKAVKEGHTPVVQDLIKNPAILAYLASQYSSDDAISLSMAVNHGHTEIVKVLLTIPVVKENAVAEDNKELRNAAYKGHTEIVKLLLAIEAVKANAAARDNYALRWASDKGHTEIMKLLLAIPVVKENAAAEDNKALRNAAENGHTEIVKLLLPIPCVVQAIAARGHGALSVALSEKHWDIVLLLLQHYGTNSIPQSRVTKVLEVPAEHPASAGIRSIICNRVMTVSGRYAATSNEAKAIDVWIGFWNFSPWPANTPINNRNWCDYLYAQSVHCTEPKQAAILLLSLNVMAENHGRHLTSQNVAGGGESAMESSLVAMVTKHYAEQVEPAFSRKFELAGGVEGVEQHIKWVILNKIIENTAEPLKAEILSRKSNILNGVEEDIIWARSKFTAKDDIYQTAWRAYDAGAETVVWTNLLTPPSAADVDKYVFNTVQTGYRNQNLKAASDIIRKMAAHYFLVAMDERLTNEEHEDALESFIAAIAEIRRAHNDDAICFA